MDITKCDLCHRVIEPRTPYLFIRWDWPGRFSLCERCAKPFLILLKEKGLIAEKKRT